MFSTPAKRLPALPFTPLTFRCRLTAPAVFSPYKGSMLRGTFGTHLRRGLCMTRAKDCKACLLGQKCIYPRLFNPAPVLGEAVPAPFCIEPELDGKIHYAQGDPFNFRLLIFGPGTEYAPFFVQAIKMAGERGMGKTDVPGTFRIEEILSRGQCIYDPELDNLNTPEPFLLGRIPCPKLESDSLALSLETPLRHKSGNHFSSTLEFLELFHLILRRIRALALLAHSQWQLPPEEYASLREKAAAIEIEENNLRWQDWTRYSSRQETHMKFGGLVGKIVYRGNFAPFAPFLEVAQLAHLGKQTSFGLGKMVFEQKFSA